MRLSSAFGVLIFVCGRSGRGCTFRPRVCHESPLLVCEVEGLPWLIVEVFDRDSHSVSVVYPHYSAQMPVEPAEVVRFE